MSSDHHNDDVQALLRGWVETERKGDSSGFASLLTDDFTGIGPAGFILSRDQWEQRFANGLTNHAFDVVEPEIRLYPPTAIIHALLQQDATFGSSNVQGTFRLGLVAVQAGGRWRLASVQISGPMPGPGQTGSFVSARPQGVGSEPQPSPTN